MRKVMLLTVMLAMVVAATEPELAQAVSVGEVDDVQYNAVCQNIVGSICNITNTQDCTIIAKTNNNTSDAV